MATGNSNSTSSLNNLNEVIAKIDAQNEQLNKLLEENKRLNESIFNETGRERVQKLIDITEKKNKELDAIIQALNKDFENNGVINFTFDSKNIKKNLENLKKIIQETKDDLGKLTKGSPEYKQKKQELKDYEKAYETLKNAVNSYYSAANDSQKELNRRQVEGIHLLDDIGEKWEQRTRAVRKGANEIAKGGRQIFDSLTKTLKPWSEANHEAMAYARTMGMSQKSADAYLSKTVSWAAKNDIGLLFNKSTAELIKMQGKYSEVLGRNVQLTDEQKTDMLAIEQFLGEDGMMDIANNLENFGLGMSDSAEFIHKTMSEATKTGIAASKLTKTIRENIKMAQNYTFKNGLEGLTSMAKKAIELKTDMSLVNGFINNVSTVEGAITTGAKLQVLGGTYTMGSDPLSMLYESLSDVEGLFDRAVGMAKGKVFYNRNTGNFEMGAMDRYLMKQAATAMGIDPSKMIDVAFREASLGKIEEQAKASAFGDDEDMVALIRNIATWDNGRAVVNIDGKDVAVSDLGEADKSKLQAAARTDSQNLQEMAINLRSVKDILTGEGKEIDNEQTSALDFVGQSISGLLHNNTSLLDTIAKIGAWGNIIGGAGGILGGVWTTAAGVIRLGGGFRNLFRGWWNGAPMNGSSMGPQGIAQNRGAIGRGRQMLRVGRSHGFQGIARMGKTAIRGIGRNIASGSVGAAFGGVTGAAISLGRDLVTGDLKKDVGGSIGRAVGTGIGTAIGSFFGPVGAMIGGFLGDAAVRAIQGVQKEKRDALRKEIAEKYAMSTPALASLMVGDNALEGNYNERQLEKIEEALKDGRLDEGELSNWLLKRLRANDDLTKIQSNGIDVRVAMAKGGYLDGKRHSEGGMPILGSDISVEGGEFVVNREATRVMRPYLEQINNGDYSVIAKKPLGEQMRVHKRNEGVSMPHTAKMEIKPISINLSGTIKLDAGNKQVDISNELLNNPQLVNKLTEMISKQLNILEYGSYNKDKFKQKFT